MTMPPKNDAPRKAEYNAKSARPNSDFEIFVNMNGVITDFERHMDAAGKRGADGKAKWAELDHKWWATMPAFDGAKEFYAAVAREGNARLLTAPVPSAKAPTKAPRTK